MTPTRTKKEKPVEGDPTKILPALADRAVPIESVEYHPRNARTHDIPKLMKSLKKNGQYKTITAQRSTGYILAGNGTLEAAKALGWQSIAVEFIDVTDDEATKIVIVDNRLSDLADYDKSALLELIESVPDDDLDAIGFTEDDVDKLRDELNDEEQADPYDSGVEQDYRAAYQVVVECKDEESQEELFSRLQGEGYDVKVLTL